VFTKKIKKARPSKSRGLGLVNGSCIHPSLLSQELKINPDFLNRNVNEGGSGSRLLLKFDRSYSLIETVHLDL